MVTIQLPKTKSKWVAYAGAQSDALDEPPDQWLRPLGYECVVLRSDPLAYEDIIRPVASDG